MIAGKYVDISKYIFDEYVFEETLNHLLDVIHYGTDDILSYLFDLSFVELKVIMVIHSRNPE